MQYVAYIYHKVKEWRKNPKWSFSCCLALLLPLSDLQGEIVGLTERNILTQQLQSGGIEMPTIANTLKESGAVEITLEDYDVERKEDEEETANKFSVAQGLLSLAQVGIHKLQRGTQDTKLEDHDSESEEEEDTTNAEKSVAQGLLSLTEVVIHKPPRGTQDTRLEDHDSESEEEEDTTNAEISVAQGLLSLAQVGIHKLPRGTQDTKL